MHTKQNWQQNWQMYQGNLQKTHVEKKILERVLKFSIIFVLLFFGIYKILIKVENPIIHPKTTSKAKNYFFLPDKVKKKITPQKTLSKTEIQPMIKSQSFFNLKQKNIVLNFKDKKLYVETSLDMKLQHFLLDKLDRLKKISRGKPRHMAIVAMEPSTGRILAMAGFNKKSDYSNAFIDKKFPAASIFKIITAAGAIEQCGLTPESKLYFHGGKYTLYKSQLKNRKNKYSNKTTLKDSFAKSINPVFGKIGALYLKKTGIEKYANAFAFKKNINFEVPLKKSEIYVSDKPYQWAEVASGFNRTTKISPLHGALISAAILNSGRMVEPTIINKISDQTGKVIYKSKSLLIKPAVKPSTSKILKKLMQGTIKYGTAKKMFRKYKRDSILSKLNIGAKTGSISNKPHTVKYDWFVGFAEEKKGKKKLAFAVVVGHEKYIGTRAASYGKMTIKEYFSNYFAEKKQKSKDKGNA